MALEVSLPRYSFRYKRSGYCLNQVTKSTSEGTKNTPVLPMSNQIAEGSGLIPEKTASVRIGEHAIAKNISRSASPESRISQSTKSVSEGTKSSPTLSDCSSTAEEIDLSSIKAILEPTSGEPMAAKNNSTPAKAVSETTGNNFIISKSYSTPSESISVIDQNNSITTDSSSGLVGRSDPPICDGMPIFWANYIHDLESIWWILIWTLLAYQKVGSENYSVQSRSEIQRRIWAIENLFDESDYYLDRSMNLKERESFNKIASAIPSFFKGLVEVAAIFREKLVSTYLEEEGKSIFPIKLMDDGLLHRDILEAFRTSPIENFDVVYIFSKNKTATESTTDSDKTSESSKRSTCEDSDEERPFKRAR